MKIGCSVSLADEIRVIVRRFQDEALNAGNLGVLDELAIAGYEEHDPVPGQTAGLAGLKHRVAMLRDAFRPQVTVEDLLAEGDRVVVRWTNRGVHIGEFMGIPPTGRSFVIAGIDIHCLRDGKLAEHWHLVDQLSLLQRLSLLPMPETANA